MLNLSLDNAGETNPDLVDVVKSIHVPDLDFSDLGIFSDYSKSAPCTLNPALPCGEGWGEASGWNDSRKAWKKKSELEARCDFTPRPRLVPRAGLLFISLWQKSLMGRTLTDIKADDAEIPHFADCMAPLISQVLGEHLCSGNWCICTSPKRRHTTKNFASLITERIALHLGIPFYEDVAVCHSKHRVNAVFEMNNLPRENNIIVFDDFVTSGSTLKSMKNLLAQYNKNFVFFAGVNNVFGKEKEITR